MPRNLIFGISMACTIFDLTKADLYRTQRDVLTSSITSRWHTSAKYVFELNMIAPGYGDHPGIWEHEAQASGISSQRQPVRLIKVFLVLFFQQYNTPLSFCQTRSHPCRRIDSHPPDTPGIGHWRSTTSRKNWRGQGRRLAGGWSQLTRPHYVVFC